MIQLSKIDDVLSIYRENKVIIWGAFDEGISMMEKLSCFDIKVHAFYDNDQAMWGEKIKGIFVLSFNELRVLNKKDNILIQIASKAGDEQEIILQLKEYGIDKYICTSEATERLQQLLFNVSCNKMACSSIIELHRKRDQLIWSAIESGYYRYIYNTIGQDKCIICTPPKTGTTSLRYTFERNGYKNFYNLSHHPEFWNRTLNQIGHTKMRVITAVRDPIAQNISLLYQQMSGQWYLYSSVKEAWENGGDIQQLFDMMIASKGYVERKADFDDRSWDIFKNGFVYKGALIQDFIPMFNRYIADIMEYPFDKDRGYSVYHLDECEIFLFQLEKLDHIKNVIFDWMGYPHMQFYNDNASIGKWYAESYCCARNSLKFSEEYFEKCYNESYVNHFYNKKDVDVFKNMWYKHIV